MTDKPRTNFGPKTTAWLHSIGINTLDDIADIGVVEVYRRLKDAYPHKVTLNALWGLQAALLGISHTQIPQSMKDDLLAELGSHSE